MKTITETSTQAESDAPQHLSWKRASRVLLPMCIGFLLQGIGYSYLNSFFNIYALNVKSLTSTEYGIIMGAYYAVIVLVAPLTGRLVNAKVFKEKTLLLIAWSIDGVFCLIMSFVHKLGGGLPFLVGSLVVRTLEAIGCAMGFVVPYIIVGLELDEIKHVIIPVLETSFGASIIAGPALSGYLFDIGGFPLPFWVLGGMLVFLVIVAIFLFPKARPPTPEESAAESVGILAALEPSVVVNVLCTISSFVVVSSNESTLARQLNILFGTSATDSGFLFLYAGGLYSASGLLSGFFSERVADPRYFMLFGQILSLVSLAFLGRLIPTELTFDLVLMSQMLLGLGTGTAFVCSYLQSLTHLSRGRENKAFHTALSAIYCPSAAFGSAVGPLVSGIIRHHYSYEAIIYFNIVHIVCATLLLFSMILSERCHSEGKEESSTQVENQVMARRTRSQ